jgi:hypothetical protein
MLTEAHLTDCDSTFRVPHIRRVQTLPWKVVLVLYPILLSPSEPLGRPNGRRSISVA